jgi:type IV pilus assembly protein PilA
MSRIDRLIAGIGGGLILFLAGACNIMSDRIDKSRLQAEEMAAIQTVRTVQTAQVQYFSQFGTYAKSLSQLGPATNGPAGAQAADLIPADVTGGVKNGYRFMLEGDGQKYTIQARPVSYGKTGNRSFYSDISLILRQNSADAPATAASPEAR